MKAIGIADLHVHTRYSDGQDPPEDVVEQARERGLTVLAVTDHDRIDGALVAARHARRAPGIEVVVGEEVSSRDGHVIGLFLEQRVEPGMSASDTVAAIHGQDGIAIAAHPYWRSRSRVPGRFPHGVGALLFDAGFDAVEVINGGFTPSMVYANLLAGWANRRAGLAEVGGSDAHVKEAVGSSVTQFAGQTAADLRRALVDGRTSVRLRRPSAVAVRRYVAWGLALRARTAAEPA